ncbi:MAG: nitrate ABC transporter substrate-binding protein [Methylobacterium sp.]|uniref:ABC transporter substrate-binding protein n=1 Tax=Bosea sp. (in: a-proteobacteria) TaxID=1871050 RepID=UPI001D2ED807|nr:ABC transporter substrate-binding protein [Bosea sp. (in: a-proteobacteria)]MBA4270942.1 nitrate ABC transporter substrate-binding protein [Methylobacterium sp.]MDP3410307.1 ABC transporter substrate-binding protein [Bosea sp. (in: a-proteobacteria)]
MTMTKYRLTRRGALGLIGGSALVAVPGARVSAQTLDKVSYQTNWRAQAEHGGFYLAAANGIYKKYGIDAEIRPGGPQQNPSQLLLGGRVDMIMSNSFEAIRYAQENIPFLCIASIFQKDPQVIISHPGVGNDSLAALKGKPILVGAAGRTSYWPFLKAKFGYTDEQIRPYTFNMAPFLADKTISQQGFLSSEPFAIQKQGGVTPVVHLIADAGFENYNTTINISRKMVDEKKDLVQRFVTASLEGWAAYMKGQDVAAANAQILKDNPDMDQEKIDYAVKVMNANGIVLSGDATTLGIGAMTDARWGSFYKTMTEAGVFPAGIDLKKAYSLEFINKGVGKA